MLVVGVKLLHQGEAKLTEQAANQSGADDTYPSRRQASEPIRRAHRQIPEFNRKSVETTTEESELRFMKHGMHLTSLHQET